MLYTINECSNEDLVQCATIIIDIYNNNELHENWTSDSALAFCTHFKNLNPHLFLVAKKEKEVVGFIITSIKPWSDGNHLFIEEVSVKEKYRKNGIASNLLMTNISYAKEHYDIKHINAETYGAVSQMPFSWYSRIGFKKNEETYLINCSIGAFCLDKK